MSSSKTWLKVSPGSDLRWVTRVRPSRHIDAAEENVEGHGGSWGETEGRTLEFCVRMVPNICIVEGGQYFDSLSCDFKEKMSRGANYAMFASHVPTNF